MLLRSFQMILKSFAAPHVVYDAFPEAAEVSCKAYSCKTLWIPSTMINNLLCSKGAVNKYISLKDLQRKDGDEMQARNPRK